MPHLLSLLLLLRLLLLLLLLLLIDPRSQAVSCIPYFMIFIGREVDGVQCGV